VPEDPPVEPDQSRPERADSRRKRLQLIDAAKAAVAEQGLDVSAAEIADRAEVGVGTLYRRFGSKDALIQGVVTGSFADIQALADEALSDSDPWQSFRAFFEALTQTLVGNRAVRQMLTKEDALEDWILAPTHRLRESCATITQRAQEHRLIRPDVTWRDIAMLAYAAAVEPEYLGLAGDGEKWRRTVAVMLDGLRAASPQPLPGEPPLDLLGEEP
jgi:AcrR family transcriptional regulator